ncbi:hypothetical protein X727_14050 [Mesorhizobium sp. L103C119B0]|uniref:hypothetical protein n=1 Tax=Mesorhizobium sp. L103C119B0 TaxID=1287085 RepID=UPI0003D02673|nr:hypothetical protein [Mesorhizobium sp. L103C119B0]ESZ70711.1 hypothetical protein X727_14050 [Mesorhizobium sp. L103C119B0]
MKEQSLHAVRDIVALILPFFAKVRFDARITEATRVDITKGATVIRFAVRSSEPGMLYAGYHSYGSLNERWAKFQAGSGIAEIWVQQPVDESHIWLQLEKPRPKDFKIRSVQVLTIKDESPFSF